MSIMDFKGIDLKIEEIYSDREKGLEALSKALKDRKEVIITNIPSWLFAELEKPLSRTKVTLYSNSFDEVRSLPKGANYTSVEMKGVFNGREIQRGNIFVKNAVFEIGWDNTELVHISSFHFRPCVEEFKRIYEEILITEEVPVINYSTMYEPDEGIKELQKVVSDSDTVRLMNVHPIIVEELYPLIGEKDFKGICSDTSPFIKSLDNTSSLRLTRGMFNFYSIYKGKKMGRGLVLTDKKEVFSIDFDLNHVVSIKSAMWTKCSTLLLDNFKFAWIQAKKIK